MNEIRRIESEADEIARVRAVVERIEFPDFVKSFEIELGEYDDELAMWVIFHSTGARPSDLQERKDRADRLREFKDRVHRELLPAFEDRYPYYRFANDDQAS